jgi:co-chaperonin GroES (HSP10)
MYVKPIFDRVLIQRDVVAADVVEKTAAGLLVPDAHQANREGQLTLDGKIEYNSGTILRTGEAVSHPDLKSGTRVYFGKYAGANINPFKAVRKRQLAQDTAPVEDLQYFICAEQDIIAIIEEQDHA